MVCHLPAILCFKEHWRCLSKDYRSYLHFLDFTLYISSLLRTEFKAYTDVKPVKLIRAKSQYQPPDEKSDLQTSYSATYRGYQAKQEPDDNKALERRRIRTLYHEPYRESSKVQYWFSPCVCGLVTEPQ